MAPKFHYQIEALFYNKDIGNDISNLFKGSKLKDSITHFKKEFHDDIPIVARENAFKYYHSILEVLYDGIGKTYINDEQSRIDLQKYFNSGNDFVIKPNKITKINISDDIFNEIGIYLIIDSPMMKDDLKGDKYLIHSIGYLENSDAIYDDIPVMIKGLAKECQYFEFGSYSFKNYYSFVDLVNIGGQIETILKTPFDWDTFLTKHNGEDIL